MKVLDPILDPIENPTCDPSKGMTWDNQTFDEHLQQNWSILSKTLPVRVVLSTLIFRPTVPLHCI